MNTQSDQNITFARLTKVAPELILQHMSDPRVAEHMPLLIFEWDLQAVAGFVAKKEKSWHKNGLGHWAIFNNDKYVGWGGFELEGSEWDFGLVLAPEHFGLGMRITKQALEFARYDKRIDAVTFLLPPSRKNLGALKRFGARQIGQIDYSGETFLKFRLDFE